MVEGQRRRRQRPSQGEPAETKESPVTELEDLYSDMQDRVCTLFDLPEDFKLHIRAAKREFLLAMRSLLDARIASLEEDGKRQQAGRRGRVTVE